VELLRADDGEARARRAAAAGGDHNALYVMSAAMKNKK
jgi:hypothetical protein